MRSGPKAAAVLLVTMPVLAYVGGTLASAPPDPGPRTPVILERQNDDGVRVVKPTPTPVGEDDGGTGDDGPEDDGPEDDDRTDDDTSDGDD